MHLLLENLVPESNIKTTRLDFFRSGHLKTCIKTKQWLIESWAIATSLQKIILKINVFIKDSLSLVVTCHCKLNSALFS